MAMQMWWRAAALEALQAFVLGPLASAPRSEQSRLMRHIGQLLDPIRVAICSHAILQVILYISLYLA